jgi:hypothetical protein
MNHQSLAASAAWLALVLTPGLLCGAPAPRPRSQRPAITSAALAGNWHLIWIPGGAGRAPNLPQRHPVLLAKDGAWWCWFDGRHWSGTWRYDKAEGTIHVVEAPLPLPGEAPEPAIRWSVKLKVTQAGPARLLRVSGEVIDQPDGGACPPTSWDVAFALER